MRTRRGSLLVVAILAAVAGAAFAATQKSAELLAHNRMAAARDARALVRSVQLPAGAVRLTAEPHGDNGYLKADGPLESDMAHRLAIAWWRVAGSVGATIAYVGAHPPAGATLSGSGAGGNVDNGTTDDVVDFQRRPVGQTLGSRSVRVTATALPGGQTGVLIQSQSDWIVPRPSSEVVPSGVGEIDLAVTDASGQTVSSAAVDTAPKVRRIVDLTDGLPSAQPIVTSCPAEIATGAHQLTVTFRSAASAPALATAQFTEFEGWRAVSGECNPVSFTIGSHAEPALIGGPYAKRLQAITGMKLAYP